MPRTNEPRIWVAEHLAESADPYITEAQRVLRVLAKHGITAIVAGGYARDLILGRTPKDMDVLILDGTDLAKLEYALEDLEGDIEVCADSYGELNLGRIDYVVKQLGVDYIRFKHDGCYSPLQQVMEFDCTLNMAWIYGDGYLCAIEDFPMAHKDVWVTSKCDRPEVRVPYLQNKFPEFTFIQE
jgi:hypothetical protein